MPASTRQERRILGIDPGTINFGYGFIIDTQGMGRQAAASAWGVIHAQPSISLPERLLLLYNQLTDLLLNLKPTELAIEEVFVGRNWRTALSLGHAQSIALLAGAQAGVPITAYPASTVKEAVSGFGGADKGQVQALVAQHLGLSAVPEPDHAADALGVALCHLWRGAFDKRVHAATTASP